MGLTREGAGRAGALGRGGPTPTAAATVSQPCPRRRRSKLAPWGTGTPATTKTRNAQTWKNGDHPTFRDVGVKVVAVHLVVVTIDR